MSRKNRAPKRDVLPDPLYNSQLVTRLINRVMLDGKRGTAASIVYGAFEQIKEATGNDALEVFETAMENIMPVLEVRARRVGGSNYQVPVEVRPERRTTLGLRWLVTIARLRGEHTMQDRLAKEILDAANNTGAAVKKREDTHRMAEAHLFLQTFSLSSTQLTWAFSPSSIQLVNLQVETNNSMKTLRTGRSCLSVFIKIVL